jgi:hypothetical protein
MNKDFKLCYIRDSFVYFTTQELDKQRGDDWDAAPYEHNAGEPYSPLWEIYPLPDETPEWEIYKVAYDHIWDFQTPANIAGLNSRYSVDMINKKLTPWLTIFPDKALFAGASIEEFVEFVESCGGTVYFPKEKTNAEA